MPTMDINEIMRHLPHRYPFLLVDRVLECEVGQRIKAVKNVTLNEPFFQGHFPGYPVMPAALMRWRIASNSSSSTRKQKWCSPGAYGSCGGVAARAGRSEKPNCRL